MSGKRRSAWLLVVVIILVLSGTAAAAFYLAGGFGGGELRPNSSSSESGGCHSTNGLPDGACTPGRTDSNVTHDNIQSTICVPGYSSSVRPPASYTEPLKIQSIQQYGYNDTHPSDYEYDHLIPLELGGNPTDTKNLWAEPLYGAYTAYDKDGFENYLHAQVCNGQMSLAESQLQIATDWVKYWLAAGQP